MVGAISGLTSSILIAVNLNLEVFGFYLYMVSSVAWIYVGVKKNMRELVWMSVGYFTIAAVGILQWAF
tara:strand:+ start:108 stop:311 length:204 start_codon:yes stop_codon:yes gene_type:complete